MWTAASSRSIGLRPPRGTEYGSGPATQATRWGNDWSLGQAEGAVIVAVGIPEAGHGCDTPEPRSS